MRHRFYSTRSLPPFLIYKGLGVISAPVERVSRTSGAEGGVLWRVVRRVFAGLFFGAGVLVLVALVTSPSVPAPTSPASLVVLNQPSVWPPEVKVRPVKPVHTVQTDDREAVDELVVADYFDRLPKP